MPEERIYSTPEVWALTPWDQYSLDRALLRTLGRVPDIDLTLRGLKISWVVGIIIKRSRVVARFFQGRHFAHIALVGNWCLVLDLSQVAAFHGVQVGPCACPHAPHGTCSKQQH